MKKNYLLVKQSKKNNFTWLKSVIPRIEYLEKIDENEIGKGMIIKNKNN